MVPTRPSNSTGEDNEIAVATNLDGSRLATEQEQTSAAPQSRRRQIVGLDGLRFFAACLVMWYHLAYGSWTFTSEFSSEIGIDFSALRSLRPFSEFGWIGVEIFFVISGFVIAFTAQGSTAVRFLRSRFLRLVPGAWICATITALFLVFLGYREPILARFLRSFFFAPVGPYICGVYWTLAIEIAFYAVVFATLAAKRFDRIETVVTVIGVLSTAFWLVWFCAVAGWPGSHAAAILIRLSAMRLTQLTLLQHGCFFAIGTILWITSVDGITRRRMVLCAVFVCAGCIQIVAEVVRLSTQNAVTPVVGWLVSMVVFVLAVRSNQMLMRFEGVIARPMRKIGLATYPLYLIHYPIGVWLLGHAHLAGLGWVVSFIAAMAALIAAAILITEYPERFLRQLLQRTPVLQDGTRRSLWRSREESVPSAET